MAYTDKERKLENDRRYHHANKERLNAAARRRYADRKQADPRYHMLAAARHRAKRDGYPCTITQDDIVIPAVCPVLGIPLQCGSRTKLENSPSLDKVVPALGYVPGNILVISWRANRIKCDATPEELRKLAEFYSKQE